MKRVLFSIIFIAFSITAFSQGGTIRGVVYDKANGEPVIYTNVILKGTSIGGQTDDQGVFNISSVPAGTYLIFCTQFGYDTAQISVTVKNNQIVNQKIFLNQKGIELQNIDVTAQREETKTETDVSMTKITTKDIDRIPSVGGSSDLAQYLQVLPGVIFTGDQGGELYIRGGSPIQNKVLLDGMTIYNPFHSIGLFSVFETDVIRSVNVFTGGFSAEYGDRLSAVLDVTTRDGNKKRVAGKVGVSPFLASAILEGPIKKQDASGSSISYLINSKVSYLDKTSPTLYSYIDTAGLPYSFQDFYGKLSFNSASGSKFSLFGFDFNDQTTYNGVSDFAWNEYGFGANFNLVPGTSKVLIGGTLSYSNYAITLTEADNKPRESSVGGFDLSTDFTYFLGKGNVKYGFDIGGFKTHLKFYNSLGLIIEQDDNSTEFAGYVLLKYIFSEKFIFEPSLRLQYYASLPVFSPEPRISLKYNVNDHFRIKGATGIYTQNFISTKSDQDVVNLFTGYLTAPDGQLNKIDGTPADNNLQRCVQAVIGIEWNVNKNLEITVEPYSKWFTQLIDINREKLFPDDPDFQIETGKAYGIDFLAKYTYKRYYLWIAYSYGHVTRNNGEQTYPTHYDRRNNLNVVGSYNWGKDGSWEFDLRYNFGSGFPFTLTQGFYEQVNFLDGINTNYTTQNGNMGIVYDDSLNSGRLPAYSRFDLALKKKFHVSENSDLEVIASVINVFNRDNIFYFDRVHYQRVNQLPILPSIGATFYF